MGVGDIKGNGGPKFNETDRHGRVVLVTSPYSQFRGMKNPGLALHVFCEIHSLARFGKRKFNKNFKEKNLDHGECVFFVRKFCREFDYNRAEVTRMVKALGHRFYWTVNAHKDGFELKVRKLSGIPEIAAAQVIHLGRVNESLSVEARRDILREQARALARAGQGLSQADFGNLIVESTTYNSCNASEKPGSVPVQKGIGIFPSSENSVANRVKGLPDGTHASGSGAEAPSLAPNGAQGCEKDALSGKPLLADDQALGGHSTAPTECASDSKTGELAKDLDPEIHGGSRWLKNAPDFMKKIQKYSSERLYE